MELQCKAEINAAKDKVFHYWTSEAGRKAWEDDLEHLEFDGAVKAGGTGKMKLADKPEMRFVIVEAVEGESYRERYELPFGVLVFSHRLLNEGDKTYMTHSVVLEKAAPSENDLAFLSGVFADFPVSMTRLKKLLEA
jgi:uncharacterized protein YndB with AHSA1/START domain